jgi:predicted GNAT family N-acyltransferase
MNVRTADFTRDLHAIRHIRFTVFGEEQHVPAELEIDTRDPVCKHVLAFVDDLAVGTGRIDVEHGGKIGRMAVLERHRRAGVGRALIDRLHQIADNHGLARTWCHAQMSAVPFYLLLGYRITGGPFIEVGIEHVLMERQSTR